MTYKGYEIEATYALHGYTVFYEGDEIYFDAIDEAKAFIEEVAE